MYFTKKLVLTFDGNDMFVSRLSKYDRVCFVFSNSNFFVKVQPRQILTSVKSSLICVCFTRILPKYFTWNLEIGAELMIIISTWCGLSLLTMDLIRRSSLSTRWFITGITQIDHYSSLILFNWSLRSMG